ncbi:MAG: hypothetical protein ACE5FP_08395 [Gemmatimonadota bacterium]
MTRRSLSYLLLLLLGLPGIAHAQDDEGNLPSDAADVVHISSWKCDANATGTLMDDARAKLVPLAQQVIDDGSWQYFQLLIHSWGDEWNVLYYTRAPSMDDYFEGWAQYISAITDLHPDALEWFREVCPEHRDNFYRSVVYAGSGTTAAGND